MSNTDPQGRFFLGLDLGTSELKALLLSESHDVVATAGSPLSVSRPHPGWSEQHPDQWWTALEDVMAQLAAREPGALGRVAAIGLSGQMHGAVLLGENDRVLRPAILWNDGRSAAECEAMVEAEPRAPQIAGNLVMPGFTAPKLLWVRRHEPQLFAAVRKVLLPKDWLRLRLTGEYFTDCSDASGTLWLDVGRRQWSADLLAATGLSEAHMPRVVEGIAPTGTLRDELARRWGIPSGIPVAGGGGDNAASAVGIGAVRPGEGFVSLGTSGVIFATTDRFAPNPARALHAFCHAVPDRWHQMSVMLAAASAVDWAARQFGYGDARALIAEADLGRVRGPRDAPFFLPYLSGERSPHNQADARGVLFGIEQSHDCAAVAYAIVEGVSFGLRDGLESFVTEAGGARPNELTLVGGGARSEAWSALLANALRMPLVSRRGGEAGGALGAARLAWLAAGGDESAVCVAPPVAHRFEPQAEAAAALDARHALFRDLYPAVSASFTKLAAAGGS